MHSEDILLPHGGPHQRRGRRGCPAHHQEGPVGGCGGGHMGGQLGFAPQATSGENWGSQKNDGKKRGGIDPNGKQWKKCVCVSKKGFMSSMLELLVYSVLHGTPAVWDCPKKKRESQQSSII